MGIELPYRQPPVPEIARDIARQRRIASLTRNRAANFVFRACDKILSYREVRDRAGMIDKLQGCAEAGGGTGYRSEAEELQVAAAYKAEIDAGFMAASFSPLLYERQQIMFRDLIARDPTIDTFLNFGVAYGYVDDILSRQARNVQFYAVDRSPLTKHYNEAMFAPRDNLAFHAADIFDFLAEHPAKNGVLFHARTATYIPKSAVAKLYEAARRQGYRYILGYEPFGISRFTGEPYEFSLSDSESVAYLFDMMMHNYPALLSSAGYGITCLNVQQIDHPNPDHRILEFSGHELRNAHVAVERAIKERAAGLAVEINGSGGNPSSPELECG